MENELLRRLISPIYIKRLVVAAHFILCLVILGITTATAQVRSVKSGNWHDVSTWENSVIPDASDAVQISNGHQVTITGHALCTTINIYPPHNSNKTEKSELILDPGATLETTTLILNPNNNRRYSSFINNGGTVKAATLQIGKGCLLENITGSIAITGDVTNNGDILTTAALLEIGGSYTIGSGSVFEQGTGTVTYGASGAANQTIAALPYHHLQLTGNSPKVPAAALNVAGNLTIADGTTFRAGNFTHTIAGNVLNNGTIISETATATGLSIGTDFVNNGTTIAGAATYTIAGNFENPGSYQAGTSTVVLQGDALQQIKGNTTFYNLHFRGASEANLHNDITIINSASISNSHFNTGTHTVTLGTNAALTILETDEAHILGTIKTSRVLTASTQENFGNIGLTLTRNNIDPGLVTVERLTGVATEISDGTESITRQYNISRSGTTDITALSMTMDLAFLPKELQAKPLSEYKLYNKNRNNEAMPVQSTVVNQTTMRHTNSNRFGTYTLAPPIAPLPVELVWFKAVKQNLSVSLQWKTASEKDNKGFEVQVSGDGKTYQTIAFVASKSGNSSLPQLYSYTDHNPAFNSTLYYRLKQIDFDNTYSYSKPVAVQAFSKQFTLQVAPNPFADHIRFAIGNLPAQITITDLNGKTVLAQDLNTQQRDENGFYKLNTNHLKSMGMYFLTVQTPDQIYQTKLLKQ